MKKILFIILLTTIYSSTTIAQYEWSQKEDFPDCNDDGVAFTVDGVIYYGLGVPCGFTEPETTDFYKYEPSTDTWTQIADFPGATRRLGVGFSINGKGYVGLGFSNGVSQNDLWEYDPAGDDWTQKSNFPGAARGATFAEVVNEKVYIGPGLTPTGSTFYPMDTWEYNPANDTWTEKATHPQIALYASRSFTIGDTIYMLSGTGGSLLLPLNDFWGYSVSSDTWTQLPDLPGSTRWYSTSFTMNGKGYYGFGLSSLNYLNDFYEYSPESGVWQSILPLPVSDPLIFNGTGQGGIAVNGSGFCLLGSTNGPSTATMQVWELNTDGINSVSTNLDVNSFFQISPNPANHVVNVKVSESDVFDIYNILGQKITSVSIKQQEKFQVDVSTWNRGVYIITSKTNPNISKKIILQ